MVNREHIDELKRQITADNLTDWQLWDMAHHAINASDLDLIAALWELGVNFSDSPFDKFSHMYNACSSSLYDVVKLLLEMGFDAKSYSVEYTPYTVVAANKGYWEIVWLLLEHGADVNAVDHCFGNSLLQNAVENGNIDTVTRLLDMGADPMLIGKYKHPHWSVFGDMGQFFCVIDDCIPCEYTSTIHFCDKHIAILDRIPPDWRDYKGMSALHMMVKHWCKDGISYLLSKGWPIDQRTSFGDSVLHLAPCRDEGVVQHLLDNGADAFMLNNNGETAYQYNYNDGIYYDGLGKMAALLRIDPQSQYPFPYSSFTLSEDELLTYTNTQASDGTTMLHHAIVGKNSELVLRLLQAGFDPNHRMNRGDTPLRRAYTAGAPISIIRSLLEFGANPELPMQEGRYYYHSDDYAPEVFALLSQHGADFNQRDDEDHTALYHAASAEIVQILRSYGCCPDLQASDVTSALFHHASMRRWGIVRHLIEQGVNPLLTDDDGRSLLHNDVKEFEFDPDAAEFLLVAGLDINAQDKYGFTPLMRAGIFSNMLCLKWLANHGADTEITDPNGRKARDWASYTYSRTRVYKYL